jgi:uncharacterized damage-inducible protein DinB
MLLPSCLLPLIHIQKEKIMTTSAAAPDKNAIAAQHVFTKQYFIELMGYINWADSVTISWLTQLTDEQWNQTAVSSFGSIKETAIHIVSAKKIWVDIWKNVPEKVYLSQVFNGTKSELIAIWKETSVELQHFIESFPYERYSQEITVIKPNAEVSIMEFRKTFPHMVNHSTYHRGQLVTLLRQAGFSAFINTDLFTYYNSVK